MVTQTLKISDNLHIVCVKENSSLARESGWYIAREYNPKTLYWVDHSRPGYGVTYWVNKDIAIKYGLEVKN